MANNIEVTGITVKIGEKLVCLTIEDARDLLRKLGDVIKDENARWYYEEILTPSGSPWTEQPWCTWSNDGTCETYSTGETSNITVTSE